MRMGAAKMKEKQRKTLSREACTWKEEKLQKMKNSPRPKYSNGFSLAHLPLCRYFLTLGRDYLTYPYTLQLSIASGKEHNMSSVR